MAEGKNADTISATEAAPAADEPAEPKRAIGEDLKENLTRPRRAAGRYDAGEAIVDTAPRRTSAEVQLAKINAQKTAEEAEAKAETHRLDQKRQIAALEDQLQRMDAVAAKHALRPDLVDHVPVEESSTVSYMFFTLNQSILFTVLLF